MRLIPGLLLILALAAPARSEERIEIPSLESTGDPAALVAFLTRPDGSGPFPAVVMLHGCGGPYAPSGQLNSRHRQWEAVFVKAGYVVLHIDSFSTRGIKEICTRRDRPRTTTAREERRRDAHAGYAYLKSLTYVRPDRVAVVGWSNGGSTTLAAMERGPAGEPAPFRAAIAFYPGCAAAGGGLFRPDGPLLILTGENDNWTPPARCLPMVEEAKGRSQDVAIHLYPGAYHDFDWPGMKMTTRTGVSTQDGTATVGENPEARADALIRAPAYLAKYLRN